jgi:guanylate kinase
MTTPARGLLVVISGPSGVGKTTIVNRLLARPGFRRAITATTRAARAGEVDHEHYHFLDDATFARWVREGRFLEHATVHEHSYGTPYSEVERILEAGQVCLLNIDVQGAATLRSRVPDALHVFLAPPSLAELERRLRGRGSESEDEVLRRLTTARAEIERAAEFGSVVINEDVEDVIEQIEGLVDARQSPRAD